MTKRLIGATTLANAMMLGELKTGIVTLLSFPPFIHTVYSRTIA